jgi:hypothetical protein
MSTITLTKAERISIYRKDYYHVGKPYLKIMRRFGGPFIIALSLYNYYFVESSFIQSLSGFTLIFGIYYTLKPLIIPFLKPRLFEGYTFQFQITPDKIILKEDESGSELEHQFFKSVQQNETHYALRTPKNEVLHLPKSQLTAQETTQLNALLTTS